MSNIRKRFAVPVIPEQSVVFIPVPGIIGDELGSKTGSIFPSSVGYDRSPEGGCSKICALFLTNKAIYGVDVEVAIVVKVEKVGRPRPSPHVHFFFNAH